MNFSSAKPEMWKIAYKLWHDGLAVLLVFFFIFLLAESVLNGVFYSPLNLAYLAGLIILWTFLGSWLAPKAGLAAGTGEEPSKKLLAAMLFVLAIFLTWSTLKFAWYESLAMVAAGLAIAYYILQLAFQPEE